MADDTEWFESLTIEEGTKQPMNRYMPRQEHRAPVGPNRQPRFIEVVTVIVMVLAAVYFVS
jgi:hypothetical protein